MPSLPRPPLEARDGFGFRRTTFRRRAYTKKLASSVWPNSPDGPKAIPASSFARRWLADRQRPEGLAFSRQTLDGAIIRPNGAIGKRLVGKMSLGGDKVSPTGYGRRVEDSTLSPTCLRERAARAAAEGEIARNLSGKRTVDGKDNSGKSGFVPRRRCKRCRQSSGARVSQASDRGARTGPPIAVDCVRLWRRHDGRRHQVPTPRGSA